MFFLSNIYGDTYFSSNQKRINQSFLESLNLSCIFENPFNGILITDLAGQIIECNTTICNILDYKYDTLKSMNIMKLVDGKHFTELSNILTFLKEIKPDNISFSKMYKTPNNKSVKLETYVSRVSNNSENSEMLIFFFCFNNNSSSNFNISYMKEKLYYEKQLVRSQIEFDKVFNSNAIGMMVTILDGKQNKIIRINDKLLKMLLHTENELINDYDDINLFFDIESRNKFIKLHDSLKSGEAVDCELNLKAKNNTKLICLFYGNALYPPHLENGIIWSIIDVTEKKELEDFKDNIDSIFRHNIKSALASVLGFPSAMLEDENLNVDQKKYLKYIYDSGKRILNHLNSSFKLKKLEDGKYIYKPEDIDLLNVIHDVITDLIFISEAKGIKIKTFLNDIDVDDYSKQFIFHSDEILLNTIFSNLLKNSVEASPKNETIKINIITEASSLKIHVNNKGVIPSEIRDSFFKKYVTFGKREGTGIGTYSVKLMVEAMDGSIHFTTNQNDGTTIYISLPCK